MKWYSPEKISEKFEGAHEETLKQNMSVWIVYQGIVRPAVYEPKQRIYRDAVSLGQISTANIRAVMSRDDKPSIPADEDIES